MPLKAVRCGLARAQGALIIVVLAVAAGAGAYAVSTQGSNTNSNEIRLSITETDPVNQVDNFVPQNVTVKAGTPVTFAVQNGDDEDRVFTVAGFGFNFTIPAHTTVRSVLTPDKAGTFTMYSPQTKPSAVSGGKPGSACTGYLTVTPATP
jgi:heme/copper-type cytochrome/quinol oxidase subunit 2